MFVEELRLVRKSENDAEQLKADAKVRVKKITEKAESEAEKFLEEAEKLGKKEYDAMIDEGVKEAESQYSGHLEGIKKDCQKMMEAARANEEAAVSFIAERIVSNSVNN